MTRVADRHRPSLRLQGYDYAQAGAYFVTICTLGRECLFGEIEEGQLRMNDAGSVVHDEWFKTAQIRPNVVLNADEFVVMPNHVHGILWLVDAGAPEQAVGATRWVARQDAAVTGQAVGTTHRVAPTRSRARSTGPASGSIGAIIAQFKSVVTKQINTLRGTSGTPVWQRNYYEHIVRNEASLARVREYIANNPLQWALDRENPANAVSTEEAAGSPVEMQR